MEILYAYIDQYKGLNQMNLNFGGQYRFTFDKEKETLNFKENKMFIDNFYNISQQGADIVNVSSIIGENGTGKSSILHFIKDNLSSGKNLEYPIVLVVKTEGKIKIFSTYQKIKIDNAAFEIEIIINPTQDQIISFGYDFRGLEATDIIYFSNIFDGTPGGSISGLHDISTNGLIYEDYKNNVDQRVISPQEDHIAIFLGEDIDRQIVLITSDIPRDLFPFRLPETLMISIYEILNSFKKDSNEYIEFEKLKQVITGHYVAEYFKVDEMAVIENTSGLHINYLIAAVLENLVRELLQVQAQGENLGFEFKFSGDFIVNEDKLVQYIKYEERIAYFFEQVQLQLQNSNPRISYLDTLISNSLEFVNFIQENRAKLFNYSVDRRNPAVYMNVYDGEVSNEEFLKNFIQFYRKTFKINRYLKFSWRNLSTGENALLNIYSRFYCLSNKAENAVNLEKHLIILIDEGDTYLHPAWQKKILFNLLEFLPVAYSNPSRERTIQIILTTNSAIPASDFLNYNTIFLQKQGDEVLDYNTIVKDSLNEQKATFAANIHTLLSDSFFISNGLRGDFANYKINEVLNFLQGTSKKKLNEDEIFRLIEQIGEPLIKNSLRELYFQKFPVAISNEIKRLTELQKKYDLNR
ncbi:AAA family ATPase [Flavobacterium sp. ASV13]|uniref:AAA family ATPase n=1 Tax=Flavobacterium sp. ASV13 TaxID=1506583 RepID=UPI0006892020|nr:AAA family ATPase [Flavobacterium sp. ASV13]